MGISALTLGGWISVYCGISLLRTTLAETPPDQNPSDRRKIFAITGYVLVAIGVAILARAIFHRFH